MPIGLALVGVGGAVATTVVAGLELIRQGCIDRCGLPLAAVANEDLIPYEDMIVAGWDLCETDLCEAASGHGVLSAEQLVQAADALKGIRPWPAVYDERYTSVRAGQNIRQAASCRALIDGVRQDLARFRDEAGLSRVVVVNLASTERSVEAEEFATEADLEAAIDRDDPGISPSMVYAYAAISEGMPFCNFTPSSCIQSPGMMQLAKRRNIPIAGRDGKTGQTLLKTVLAPAFRSRSLRVEGWFSMNLLGNRDGLALADPGALDAKLATKMSGLDSMLGYTVENHQVRIEYYPPRGDSKQAVDIIDVVGFLGAPMQLQITLNARDSILAAPLVIELTRLLDLAARRECGGVQEQFGYFFKDPLTDQGSPAEYGLFQQEARLTEWLAKG